MTETLSERQRQILELLLQNKQGLNMDEIAGRMIISRNAVRQHMAGLISEGYVQAGTLQKTAGRPVRNYILTESGINSFPKQYAWFSELMLTALKDELGPEAFEQYMRRLGHKLSQDLSARFKGKSCQEKLPEMLDLMNGLGFKTSLEPGAAENCATLVACNCVYHDLAQKHPEICEFDRTLISALLDKKIAHVECMAKGGQACRFKIIQDPAKK